VLLAQLEAFSEVARLGNVSRAADTLSVTQPALTARLQGLERELGVDLFVRGARGMTLTDAGRALLPYAQRAIAQVLEGQKAVDDLRLGKVGQLFIAAAPAVSTYVLPALLKAFQTTHPNVRMGVRTGHTEEVLEMVLRREVDLGVGRPIQHQDAELIPVFDDELVLVVSRHHPFARRDRIRLQELAGGLSRVAPPIAGGRLAREVRALAARERGADRLRRRIHRQRERGAGVVDETGFSERDASEITEECAVACTEIRRVLLGRAELRAHEVTIARARADDRLERPMHRDPLGRAGELRIVRDLRDENRSATWVAAERGELGPGEC